MERLHYPPIKQFRVRNGACEITDPWSMAKVTASSPAIEVMTDLRRIPRRPSPTICRWLRPITA